MRIVGVALMIALGGLTLTGAASADRPSTPEEHRVLAAAAGMPPVCLTSRISGADPTWASMVAANEEDACPFADGVLLFHFDAGAWWLDYQGPGDVQVCPIDAIVPDAVARDFGLCVAPSRNVHAIRGDRLVVRPRVLIQGAHGAYERLRWRGWGKTTAVARGQLHYADRDGEFRAPVEVRLSGIRHCDFNQRTYMRQTVRAVRASDRARLRFATGTINLSCPSS